MRPRSRPATLSGPHGPPLPLAHVQPRVELSWPGRVGRWWPRSWSFSRKSRLVLEGLNGDGQPTQGFLSLHWEGVKKWLAIGRCGSTAIFYIFSAFPETPNEKKEEGSSAALGKAEPFSKSERQSRQRTPGTSKVVMRPSGARRKPRKRQACVNVLTCDGPCRVDAEGEGVTP